MATTEELLDKLICDCKKPGDLIGKNGLLNKFREQNRSTTGTDETHQTIGLKQQ